MDTLLRNSDDLDIVNFELNDLEEEKNNIRNNSLMDSDDKKVTRDLTNVGLNDSEEENEELSKKKLSFITSTNKKISIELDLENGDIFERINQYCKLHHYSDGTQNEIINKAQEMIDKEIVDLNDKIKENSISSYEIIHSEVTENEYSKRINQSSYEEESEKFYVVEEAKSNSTNDNNNIIKPQEENNSSNKNNVRKNNMYKKKKKMKRIDYEIGQKLYHKRVEILNEKKKKREQEQMEKSLDERRKYFKPTINNYSKILNKSSDICTKYKNMKVEDRLIEIGKENKKKNLKKYIQFNFLNDLYTEAENSKRSHTPIITRYKFKKKRDKNVFNSLYQYHKIYENKREDLKKQIYKKICHNNSNITKPKPINYVNKVYPNEAIEIFTEIKIQVSKPKKKIEEKKKEKILIQENLLDDKNLLSASNRKYTLSKKNWMETANRIIENGRKNKYKEIFDLLDDDKDNYISYNKINTANCNAKALKPIIPIIQEIIEKKEEMITFKQFYERINEYLNK